MFLNLIYFKGKNTYDQDKNINGYKYVHRNFIKIIYKYQLVFYLCSLLSATKVLTSTVKIYFANCCIDVHELNKTIIT